MSGIINVYGENDQLLGTFNSYQEYQSHILNNKEKGTLWKKRWCFNLYSAREVKDFYGDVNTSQKFPLVQYAIKHKLNLLEISINCEETTQIPIHDETVVEYYRQDWCVRCSKGQGWYVVNCQSSSQTAGEVQ